jgi:16S rRNA G1207 methylase RsmC
MPYLRFKGFSNEYLHSVAPRLIEEFAQLVQIDKSMVKIETLLTEAISQVPLSLEILLFPRKQEVHDAVAAKFNEILRESGYEHVHIFFILLSPYVYYKNGEPIAHRQADEDTEPAFKHKLELS